MPRRKGRSLSREDVVAQAIACVAAEGPAALGINRVARALNIKPPSLYNHVRGGDDLKEAVAIEGWRRLGAAMAAAADDGSRVRRFALAYRDWVVTNPGLYAVMSDTSLDPKSEEFSPVNDSALDLFQPLVANLEPDEAIHALRAVRSALHGFVGLSANGQFRLGVSTDASFEWLVRALERILTPTPSSTVYSMAKLSNETVAGPVET